MLKLALAEAPGAYKHHFAYLARPEPGFAIGYAAVLKKKDRRGRERVGARKDPLPGWISIPFVSR
jgi:hypothetical protein